MSIGGDNPNPDGTKVSHSFDDDTELEYKKRLLLRCIHHFRSD